MQPYLNTDAGRLPARRDPGSEMTLRLRVRGRLRTAALYRGAADIGCGPLFVLLHDARGRAATLRNRCGLAFERWADRHGACLLYPEALAGGWNDLRLHAPTPARRLDVDDVGFVQALLAHLGAPRRSYAIGFGAGGHLVWRLAAQADARFAGYAAIGANLARPEHAGFSLARLEAPVLLIGDGPRTRSHEGDHERSTAESLAALRAVAAPGVAVRRADADWLDIAAQLARGFGEEPSATPRFGSLL